MNIEKTLKQIGEIIHQAVNDAVQIERLRWMDQKANEHDNKIRQSIIQEAIEKIEKMEPEELIVGIIDNGEEKDRSLIEFIKKQDAINILKEL